jgi:hypothetical protein
MSSVPDTRWDGNDWGVHKTRENTRERPFHARHGDYRVGTLEDREMGQKAVNPSNTDVKESFHTVPRNFRGDSCLFRNRDIRRSSSNHDDFAHSGLGFPFGKDETSSGMEGEKGEVLPEKLIGLLVRTGGKEVRNTLCQVLQDGQEVFSALPRTVHNLRETLSQVSVMVDLGKTKVCEREIFQNTVRLLWGDFPPRNTFKKWKNIHT